MNVYGKPEKYVNNLKFYNISHIIFVKFATDLFLKFSCAKWSFILSLVSNHL